MTLESFQKAKRRIILWWVLYLIVVSIVPSIGIVKKDISTLSLSPQHFQTLLTIGIFLQLSLVLVFYFVRNAISERKRPLHSLLIALMVIFLIPLLSSLSLKNIIAFNQSQTIASVTKSPFSSPFIIQATYFKGFFITNLTYSAVVGAILITLLRKFKWWTKLIFLIIAAYVISFLSTKIFTIL